MTNMQRMTNQGEWFAAFGATAGWTGWLHSTLDPILLILALLLTVISLYICLPKFLKRLKTDWERFFK